MTFEWAWKLGDEMRIMKRAACLIALGIVGISLAQWVQILASRGHIPWQQYHQVQREKRRINLHIQVRDQLEHPAPDFPLGLTVVTTRWFFWVFPLSSLIEKSFSIKTNALGEATLDLPFEKAASMRYRMLDTSKYVFPENKPIEHYTRFEDHPGGEFPLPPTLADGTQQVTIHVFKHEPREPLAHCKLPYWVKQDLEDISLFKVNLNDLELSSGKEPDLILTIKEAKSFITNPHNRWSMNLKAGPTLEMVEIPLEVITNAPESGYQKELLFLQLNASWHYIYLFARRTNVNRYYFIQLSVTLGRLDGIRLLAEADYNPRGSTNFYFEFMTGRNP